MAKYRVQIDAQNFLVDMDGRRDKYGFITFRDVEAADPRAAELAAVELLRGDAELRDRSERTGGSAGDGCRRNRGTGSFRRTVDSARPHLVRNEAQALVAILALSRGRAAVTCSPLWVATQVQQKNRRPQVRGGGSVCCRSGPQCRSRGGLVGRRPVRRHALALTAETICPPLARRAPSLLLRAGRRRSVRARRDGRCTKAANSCR